jgi:RimJ/RimL family protein N-acetyltransferase
MNITAKYFSEEDIQERVKWINTKSINHTMFFDFPATIEKTKSWFNNNIGNTKRVDFTFYDNNTNIIAMGGFTSIDSIHSNSEFYIMVNPAMHGKGVGTKVSKWLFNYAFLKYNLNKIYLYTNDENTNAYKLYENCGFKLEGVLRKHKIKNGIFQNRRFYGLLRSEWQNLEWREKELNYTL